MFLLSALKPASLYLCAQATAELNEERSARLTAEQQVLKLRGQLDAIAQVRGHIIQRELSALGCIAWMHSAGWGATDLACLAPHAFACIRCTPLAAPCLT